MEVDDQGVYDYMIELNDLSSMLNLYFDDDQMMKVISTLVRYL